MRTSINAIDVAIGARIKARRREMGIGLETLADALGVTYAQMEQFEAGTERIGATLLSRAATALDVNVTAFFPVRSESLADMLDDSLIADTMTLNRVFVLISDPNARKTVIDLATMLAASGHSSGAKN